MEPTPETLRMYGAPSKVDRLPWSWVAEELEAAGTYWVVAKTPGLPHPRPVWGVWLDDALALSIGSPVLARQLDADPSVTVHLDSGTDVVIVEGLATPLAESGIAPWIAAYNAKYDWDYRVDEYGPLTKITPTAVMAWRAAGWAGREGFQQVARWRPS